MRFFKLVTLVLFMGCTQKPTEIGGLWQLKEVDIDGWTRDFKPTFIQFDPANSFAVSREKGDITGVYKQEATKLQLYSSDQKWFGEDWNTNIFQGNLIMTGRNLGYRTTKLTWAPIETFPSFDDFVNKLIGNWDLYKVVEKKQTSKVHGTSFTIPTDSTYQIIENGAVIENGEIILDARHQKITFISSKIKWDAWFLGEELRLENKEMELTYRFKKN